MSPENPDANAAVADATLSLARELSAAMTHFNRTLRRATRRGLTLEPLSSNEVDLLRLAGDQPGIRVGDAAVALALSPNTMTTLVNQVCEVGFLHRERATDDRRVVRLSLSKTGAARLATWRDVRAETLASALSDVSRADRDALAAVLQPFARVAERLERLNEGLT